MLRYTGHPFVDVGVATVLGLCNHLAQDRPFRYAPEELEAPDLEIVADFLKDLYCENNYKPVQNFISVIFSNAHFTQPAKTVEDKRLYADEVLFAFRPNTPPLEDSSQCVFFPEKPAVMYATRQHIPLLNGATVSNFSGLGRRGIPVSGEALLAVHAMPLGCVKCANLLALHQLHYMNDPSPDMNSLFAELALIDNLGAIQRMSLNSDVMMPSFGSSPKTRYVEAVLHAQQELRAEGLDPTGNTNITGYYFTNYGPKPDLRIIQLDSTVFRFIDNAQQDAGDAWGRVVKRSWLLPRGETAEPTPENTRFWRNQFYEALFGLPQEATRFLRYLRYGNWRLIEIFLREVMQMDQERIDTYKALGDRLGNYMLEFEAPAMGFYHRIAGADKYSKFRIAIKSAATKVYKSGAKEPLIDFDEFIRAFEHPSMGYSQWRLGRDLIAIRMLEILHTHRDQFDKADLPDDFAEEDIEEE